MSQETAVEAMATREIGLDLLTISDLNPRGKESEIEEIRASLREHKKLFYPLKVRQAKGGKLYEILDGSRRYRAAKAEGWKSVPCDELKLNDQEALAFILTVQLQHRDLDPVEEARTVDRLLKLGLPMPQIAKRVGKPLEHLTLIRALVNMLKDVEKEWRKGKISLAGATCIAREPMEVQLELAKCLASHYDTRISDTAVRNWCSNTHVDLKTARWNLKDATLHGGACSTCPFRTGADDTLFADIENRNTCLRPSCFKEKQAGFIAGVQTALAKKGKNLPIITSSYNSNGKAIGSAHYTTHITKDNRKFAKEALDVDSGVIRSVVFVKDFKPVVNEKKIEAATKAAETRQRAARKEEQLKAKAFKAQVADILRSKKKMSDRDFLNTIAELSFTRALSDTTRLIGNALKIEPVVKKTQWGKSKDVVAPMRTMVKRGDVNRQAFALAVAAAYDFLHPGAAVDHIGKAFSITPLATYVAKERKAVNKKTSKATAKTNGKKGSN